MVTKEACQSQRSDRRERWRAQYKAKPAKQLDLSIPKSRSENMTRCLIADIVMPEMTGPELYRELQAQGRAIPVIFITAHKDETEHVRLLAEGAVDCLHKPFSDTELQAALDVAVGSAQ
jgi:FixJ family two-component response regulator